MPKRKAPARDFAKLVQGLSDDDFAALAQAMADQIDDDDESDDLPDDLPEWAADLMQRLDSLEDRKSSSNPPRNRRGSEVGGTPADPKDAAAHLAKLKNFAHAKYDKQLEQTKNLSDIWNK